MIVYFGIELIFRNKSRKINVGKTSYYNSFVKVLQYDPEEENY